jgi:uncharacterized protein (TIGR02145 family)
LIRYGFIRKLEDQKPILPAMKKIVLLIILQVFIVAAVNSQRPTMQLTFTALDNETLIPLDSIKIMNRTQGGDTVLHWPDNILLISYVIGMYEWAAESEQLRVFQNYPNPTDNQTTITIYIPENGNVILTVSDITGRQHIAIEKMMERGYHLFRFNPGDNEIYFFTASVHGYSESITVLYAGPLKYHPCSLEYMDPKAMGIPLKSVDAINDFPFSPGDELLFIGYSGILESGMLAVPETNETFTFQFATNIPCPGTPTVNYEGQVYNTIQIFSQCWLKENLNVGTMIPGAQNMADNSVIEKYCYNDVEGNCSIYGGLYQWNEMMQYQSGTTHGICPPGWHIPLDEEWKVLEGAVDSQYGIGDPVWDDYVTYRGYDAGKNLKSISGWNSNGNGTDLYGFSGLAGGYRFTIGLFLNIGENGHFWTSSRLASDSTWYHMLDYGSDGVAHYDSYDILGLSIRCLKD